MWESVPHFQQFFQVREWKRSFAVQQPTQAPFGAPIDIIQGVEGMLQKRQQEIEERKKRTAVQKNITRCKADPWLDFTGWDSHLAGFDREELISLMQPAAGEDEKDAEAVYHADLSTMRSLLD